MPFNFKDYKLNENNDDIVRSPSKNQVLLERCEKSSPVNESTSTALVNEVSLFTIAIVWKIILWYKSILIAYPPNSSE